MGMIVCTEKEVIHTVIFRNYPKQTTHLYLLNRSGSFAKMECALSNSSFFMVHTLHQTSFILQRFGFVNCPDQVLILFESRRRQYLVDIPINEN
jgi:hypothetical protein